MRFSVKSGGYLEELKRRASKASSKGFGARVTVPEDMKWWVYQEFGTATRRENDPTTEKYTIKPVRAKSLEFMGDEGEPIRVDRVEPHLHEDKTTGQWYMKGGHPGVYPQYMVGGALDDIGQIMVRDVCTSLIESRFDLEAAKETLLETTMPKVKELITERFDELLSKTMEPLHPKLEGRGAGQVFDEEAVITETEV